MKRPDIQTLVKTLGVISAGVTLHQYYLTKNQSTPDDTIQSCNKGFEDMRKMLNEHKEFFEAKRQFQSQLNEELLNNKIKSIESLLGKIKNGEKIDPKTDADFKNLDELRQNLKALKDNASEIFKTGPNQIIEEQISSNMGNAVENFNNGKESSSSNSVDLLFNNNNLVAEITDYIKSYNE
jgi:hypothetical protein